MSIYFIFPIVNCTNLLFFACSVIQLTLFFTLVNRNRTLYPFGSRAVFTFTWLLLLVEAFIALKLRKTLYRVGKIKLIKKNIL